MMVKERLFTPGPTPVPERVLRAISQGTMHHRSPAFKEVFTKVREKLKNLMKTSGEVLLLTSSGTGAMDAVVSNLFSEGEEVLVVVAGKFGERWLELAETYRLKPVAVELEWGKSVKPEDIEKALGRRVAGVLLQICETSTGAFHDVKKVADVVRALSPDALIVADGITAYGVYDIPTDEWGIDVAITGSQKALMTPPGIAVVSLGERAIEKLRSTKARSYYFDLKRELKNQKEGQTAYTAGVNLVLGIAEALKMIEEEGISAVAERHSALAQAVRAGVKAIGLSLLPENPANGVTAVKLPQEIDGRAFLRIAREKFGAVIAGGQGKLRGKIFRLSHMGYIDAFDILTALHITELALAHAGYRSFEPCAGVAKAREVIERSFGSAGNL
jgi:aspartate aminotransferase-like enzyme